MLTMTNKEELVEVAEETVQLLPLCEANRSPVVDPTIYATNTVFNVASLKLIDKAP